MTIVRLASASDLIPKVQFSNSTVSNPTVLRRKIFFNYSAADEDVLDIVTYENVRESHVVSSNMQESSHLPIIFRYVYHIAF